MRNIKWSKNSVEAFDRGFINQEFDIKSRGAFQKSLFRSSLRTLSSQDGKGEEDIVELRN